MKRKRIPTFMDLFMYIQKCELNNGNAVSNLFDTGHCHYPYRKSDNNGRPGWSFGLYSGRYDFIVYLPNYASESTAGTMKITFHSDERKYRGEPSAVRIWNMWDGMRDDEFFDYPIDTPIDGPDSLGWADKLIYGKPVQKLFMELLTSRRGIKIIEGPYPPDYDF